MLCQHCICSPSATSAVPPLQSEAALRLRAAAQRGRARRRSCGRRPCRRRIQFMRRAERAFSLSASLSRSARLRPWPSLPTSESRPLRSVPRPAAALATAEAALPPIFKKRLSSNPAPEAAPLAAPVALRPL